MKPNVRVLVSGARIAGLSTAYWLVQPVTTTGMQHFKGTADPSHLEES